MAQHDWILDVLVDLKSFATANDLGALAEQLDDTMLIAVAEIASMEEGARAGADGKPGQSGSDHNRTGRHLRA